MAHITCSSRRGIPVASIGKVNLRTGRNAMFGTVWNCWEEDPRAHNMLLTHGTQLFITHTCGEGEKVGDTCDLVHDQSGRRIGSGKWTVVAVAPHTKEGLAQLADAAEKVGVGEYRASPWQRTSRPMSPGECAQHSPHPFSGVSPMPQTVSDAKALALKYAVTEIIQSYGDQGHEHPEWREALEEALSPLPIHAIKHLEGLFLLMRVNNLNGNRGVVK